MRFLTAIIAAAWALAAGAQAAPSAKNLAAIALVENHLTPLEGGGSNPAPVRLAARMAELKVPGVSIAFIESGKVSWTRAYGVADAATGQLVSPDTLFQAASMSKAVAAAGALRLVEQGKLNLDGDINSRLTTWKVPLTEFIAGTKVTLRQLLSHTAGLTVGGFPGYQAGRPIPTTLQILDGSPPANTPAVRSFEAPGGRYAYSGGGYTVAQQAMIDVGAQPYPRLLQSLLLGPARMRSSTLAQPLPLSLVSRAASGHDDKGAVIPGARNTYPEFAAAGLWTTPSDYGRFMIGLQNAYDGRGRTFLRRESAQAMLTPVDAEAGYGLGWGLGRWGGHPYFEHGGSNEGFRCDAFAFLDGSRQGVVIMTNGDSGGLLAAEIFRAVASAYSWGEQEPRMAGGSRLAPFIVPAVAK